MVFLHQVTLRSGTATDRTPELLFNMTKDKHMCIKNTTTDLKTCKKATLNLFGTIFSRIYGRQPNKIQPWLYCLQNEFSENVTFNRIFSASHFISVFNFPNFTCNLNVTSSWCLKKDGLCLKQNNHCFIADSTV